MLRWEPIPTVNGLCGVHHCPSPLICYQAATYETPDDLKLCLEPGHNPNNMQRTISFDSHWFYILAFWSLVCTFVAGAAFSCLVLYLCHSRGGRREMGLVAIGRNTIHRIRALGSHQQNQRQVNHIRAIHGFGMTIYFPQSQPVNNAPTQPNNLVQHPAGPSAARNRLVAESVAL